MADRVSQFLLDEGHISQEQYVKARRSKEFFGGSLDAHLLKLGFIQEDKLGSALSDLTGCPYAGPGQLRIVDISVVALVSQEVAEHFNLCPFERDGDVLRVAMLNPRDAVAVGRVETATRLTVEAWITSRYRLNLALERHYRIQQQQYRSLSLGPQTPAEQELSEAEASQTAKDTIAEESWTNDIGLDGRPIDAEVTEDQFSLLGNTSLFEGESAAVPEKGSHGTEPEPSSLPAGKLAEVSRALATAGDVETVNNAILDYCSGMVTRCAVFGITDSGFKCSSGRGRSLQSGQAGSIAVPAGNGHLFDQVLEDGRNFYLGPVPRLPANQDLYSLLGGTLPPMVMILPLMVRSRVVALLYLDNDTDPIDKPDIPNMRRLAVKAGLAFELLLLKRKLENL